MVKLYMLNKPDYFQPHWFKRWTVIVTNIYFFKLPKKFAQFHYFFNFFDPDIAQVLALWSLKRRKKRWWLKFYFVSENWIQVTYHRAMKTLEDVNMLIYKKNELKVDHLDTHSLKNKIPKFAFFRDFCQISHMRHNARFDRTKL
jgi:hypothetical protein